MLKPLRLLLVLLPFVGPALAHHSFAMFDTSKTMTLQGVVRNFQWSNPHAVLLVLTDATASQPGTLWSVELSAGPANLKRLGWNQHSLKQGDALSVEISPARDGSHGGSLQKVTLVATGQILVDNLKALATATP